MIVHLLINHCVFLLIALCWAPYLPCSLSALCQLKSLQRYWMNTARVTSGLKFPLGFGAGGSIQPGRWIPLHFHRILLLQVSCHAVGAVASRANWFKCYWSGFFNQCFIHEKRKFGSRSLEKTEFEWDQTHDSSAQSLSVCSGWEVPGEGFTSGSVWAQ